MLKNTLRTWLMGLAVSASLFGCAHQDNGGVSTSTAQSAQAVGARLAQQDREQAERYHLQIIKASTIDRVAVKEDDRWMRVSYRVTNRSSKPISRFDVALEVYGAADGKKIATTEMHETTTIAPHADAILTNQFPYTKFGDDTGAMREAAGKPQKQSLYIKWIKFADGSEAGYDD